MEEHTDLDSVILAVASTWSMCTEIGRRGTDGRVLFQ